MIKINAVGDLFLGDYTVSIGFGIRSSIYKYGYEHHLKNVKKNLNDGDVVFANLETIISDVGKQMNNIQSIICRGENDFVKILKYGGFNAVNIANNHILQHGEDAFNDTVNVLYRNNIDVIGLRGDKEYLCNPLIKSVNGIKIGILGYSFVNENFHKGELSYSYANNKNINIIHDIKTLKNETDFVIVSCHWGIEFIDKPSPNMRRIARGMVDSGASIILGHHPHVVQGIERYQNSVIFYSLGNFLFDFLWNRLARESIIAKIYLDNDKIDYEVIPIFINNKYQVLPMEKNESDNYIQYIENLNKQIKEDNRYDIEDYNLDYYIEANKLQTINQLNKFIYILRNGYRLDKMFIKHITKRLLKIEKHDS